MRGWPVLLAAGLAFAGLAVTVWTDGDDAGPAGGAGVVVGPAPVSGGAAAGGEADRAAQAEVLLGRPMFVPGRRPPAAGVAPVAEPVAAVPAAAPRLAGVMLGPEGGQAIFVPPGGKPVVVGVGGRVGVYAVLRIAPGEVEVAGPAGTATLRPAFAPGAPVTAAGSGDPVAPSPRPAGGHIVPAAAPGPVPASTDDAAEMESPE